MKLKLQKDYVCIFLEATSLYFTKIEHGNFSRQYLTYFHFLLNDAIQLTTYSYFINLMNLTVGTRHHSFNYLFVFIILWQSLSFFLFFPKDTRQLTTCM